MAGYIIGARTRSCRVCARHALATLTCPHDAELALLPFSPRYTNVNTALCLNTLPEQIR